MLIRISSFILLSFIILGCNDNRSLITDKKTYREVKKKAEQTRQLAANRAEKLFDFEKEELSSTEKEALDFLYAWMPLSDLSNHNKEYNLQQVRHALKARESLSWGKKIPNNIFLHYVLPYRVNDEYTDTARMVFYRALKDRVKDLSLREAALEVNHWCQEKVVYQSTDGYRTSAPLSTVKTAYGRCGEQSTFTVTAMRSVGIPARQIYTPRWAHTNDNHAWVEVWINGNWYFMGACEPEPELNMGWFESPATRAMLTHHRTYGHSRSAEEVVSINRYFTEVNTLSRYAPTKRVWIKVQDKDENPVQNATVKLQLPNYAEFYNIATLKTDSHGFCALTTGRGDLMTWVAANEEYTWQKLPVTDMDTLIISLGEKPLPGQVYEHLIRTPQPSPTKDHSNVDRPGHTARLNYGDSLRHAYVDTFIDSLSSLNFSRKLGLNPNKTFQLFKKSRGNWKVIQNFLEYAIPRNKEKAFALLSVISPKDKRDTPLPILKDHFDHSPNPGNFNQQIYQNYILNPRIHNEKISAYKQYFQKHLNKELQQKSLQSSLILAKWVTNNIAINDKANPWKVPQTPIGALELKVADSNSQSILFVAIARSFGIPSRINHLIKRPEVLQNNEWTSVDLASGNIENKAQGSLILTFEKTSNTDPLPAYFKDFTINYLDKNEFKTLDYSNTETFNQFPANLNLDEGHYSLVTVKRLPDGSSKTRRLFIEIKADEKKMVPLIIPKEQKKKDTNALNPKINLNHQLTLFANSGNINTKELFTKSGITMIWIDPAREPSKHLLNDLVRLRSNFNNWTGNILLIVDQEKIYPGFNPEEYQGLPAISSFAIDETNWLASISKEHRNIRTNELPVALVINGQKEIIYQSSGYRIGIGDDILRQVVTGCAIP